MSEVDISKYAALYEYQKNQFSIVKGHYEKLEDKATKYLTYLSIFITAFSLLAKYYFIDTNIKAPFFLTCLTSLYLALTFIFVCLASGKLFSCLQVKEVFQVNTDDQMIDYFQNNKIATVYLGLAHHYKKVISSYTEKNDEKANLLHKAFDYIQLAGAILVIVIILIILGKFLG